MAFNHVFSASISYAQECYALVLICFLHNVFLFLLSFSVFLKPFPLPLVLRFLFHLCSLSLSRFDFQGIPGEPGKRGKMGRPVKFCLNILYR